MNYFKLFNIPLNFQIEQSEIDEKYFKLQMDFHPDKAETMGDKRKMVDAISKINSGYLILKNHLQRAIHLLEIKGFSFNDEITKTLIDKEELLETLEKFEEIEHTENNQLLSDILLETNIKKEELLESLGNLFEKHNFLEARKVTVKLKYKDNLIETIKTKLQNISAANRNTRAQ